MAQKNRLVSTREIKRVVKALEELGVPIGSVDIRQDGVTVFPPTHTPNYANGKPSNDIDDFFESKAG